MEHISDKTFVIVGVVVLLVVWWGGLLFGDNSKSARKLGEEEYDFEHGPNRFDYWSLSNEFKNSHDHDHDHE